MIRRGCRRAGAALACTAGMWLSACGGGGSSTGDETEMPAIAAQPASVAASAGESAAFHVGLAGNEFVTYQWLRDGVAIDGADGDTLVLKDVTADDNGAQISVSIESAAGTVVSEAAVLTIDEIDVAPDILEQPQSLTVTPEEPGELTVAAVGAGLRYQWQKNGVDIAGADQPTLKVGAGEDTSIYRVIVTNAGGEVASDESPVTSTKAATAPTITAQPKALTVNAGRTATFSVKARGTATLKYQWRVDGVNIRGATRSSYTSGKLSVSDDGKKYSVVVSNSAGQTLSRSAAVTVRNVPAAPWIESQPRDATVRIGKTGTFRVGADGSRTLRYQWYRDGKAIRNATRAAYTPPATRPGDDATLFHVVVRNDAGSVKSRAAKLTVLPAHPVQEHRLSIGWDHTVAIRKNGRMLTWGANFQEQLGNGAPLDGSLARRVDLKARSVSASTPFTWALGSNGRVYGWGTNTFGQLGNLPSLVDYKVEPKPVAIPGLDDAIDILATGLYGLVIRSDATVWQMPGTRTWDPSVSREVRIAPVRIPGLSGMRKLVLGDDGEAWAIRADGTVWSIRLPSNTAVTGRIEATVARVANLSGIVDVACSLQHCLAMKKDSTLVAWGRGALGDGVSTETVFPVAVKNLKDVVDIAAISETSVALTRDGQVWVWGRAPINAAQTEPITNVILPTPLAGLGRAAELASNQYADTLVIRMANGTIKGWGKNWNDQLGIGNDRETALPVTAVGIDLDR